MTEEHRDERPMITGKKYFILLPGRSKPQEDIIRNVLQQTPDLEEVFTEEECDFILAFCIIVSRAGTDIDAAVNELNAVSETKPAVFMVLHHTFDTEKMVSDSCSHVTRMNTLAVDCLFYEDKFLDCVRNREALERIKQCFPPQDTRTQKKKTKASPDSYGATAGTSTGTHSESAPPEQPAPTVASVSSVSGVSSAPPSAEARPSGRILTHAVPESQQQIVMAIGEINSHLKNITDALTDISHSLNELVKKLTSSPVTIYIVAITC
ncbi:uncharacterized protein [Chanodichthys erythropterus]|uniref:uncharacterized protein n=1 Tax=Chanodichthys erythropterus TaxID=933992 RepID=UPI00351F0AC9